MAYSAQIKTGVELEEPILWPARNTDREFSLPINVFDGPLSGENDKSGVGTPTQSSKIIKDYEQISSTMLCCEAGSLQAGIPWLPPTEKIRKYRGKYFSPLGEFLRDSLGTVSTDSLESFADDLSSVQGEKVSPAFLGIEIESLVERLAFFVLLIAFSFFASVTSLFMLTSNIKVVLGLSTLATLLSAIPASTMSSDYYRRKSFYCLLHSEIARRRGIDTSDDKGIKICPFTVKPLEQ